MRPEVVRFATSLHPYQVILAQCDNLECECTEVTFNFREVVGNDPLTVGPIAFKIRIDSKTWKELDPPIRSPQILQLVQEFLRDYPPSERETVREIGHEKQLVARRLKEYRIDPRQFENGQLIAFGDIILDRTNVGFRSDFFFWDFECEGVTYFVDDLYCLNPECDCQEVHLAFFRSSPTPDVALTAEHDFLAKLSLDGGHAKVVDRDRGVIAEAKAILAAWQRDFGDDFEELRFRYKKVKEIARRSGVCRPHAARQSGVVSHEALPADDHAGRNDPCPCGSGKKYKKCCARRNDVLSELQ